MSAGTLTVHQIFDVLTGFDALVLQAETATSTIYVDNLVSPAVRIVFEHDPAAPGQAKSFTIEGPTGTPLFMAGDYAVSLAGFEAALALGGVAGALAVLLDGLGTLALAEGADLDLATLKDDLRIEGNDEGTEFEVLHAATTVDAGGGDDFIVLRTTSNGSAFNGGDGYDVLWLDTSLGIVDVLMVDDSIFVSGWDGRGYSSSVRGIEFFRGSIGTERFASDGEGTRFEGGAGYDQFQFWTDSSPRLVDVVAYADEGGGGAVVVNLGFDPFDTSTMSNALEGALTVVLAGDDAPVWSGYVRDTFGDLDLIPTGFIIEGSGLADFFYGSGVDDAFLGNAGADHFFGGDGSDRIEGGEGEDAVHLSGAFDAYAVSYDASSQTFTIVANDGSGTDTIKGVERFWFGDEEKTAAELMPAVSLPVAGDDTNSGDPVVEAGDGTGDAMAAGNVLTNDVDADDDPIIVVGIRTGDEGDDGDFAPVGTSTEIEGTYGTLTIAQDGAWSYALDDDRAATNALAAGASVLDIFAYEISAGGETDAATLEIAVEGRNDAPQAGNDSGLATGEDQPLVIAAATLLANDADPDNDTLTIASVSSVTGGTATLNANGTITFVPTANFNGQAQFSYRVEDAAGALSASAMASIGVTAVNDAPRFAGVGPLAAPTVLENTTYVASLSAVDVDSASLTFSLGGLDARRFAIVGNTLRFTAPSDYEAPADSDRNNAYQLTVTVSDGVLSETRSMTVIVRDAVGNAIKGTKAGDRIDSSHAIGGRLATREADTIDGRAGNDAIAGAAGNDVLLGGPGHDRLNGDTGNDILRGGAGRDRLDGGVGRDTADFSDAAKSVVLALNGTHQARARVGGATDDLVRNVENVTGGRRADQLTGDGGANVLVGNNGNDVLAGGLGADTLVGGAGRDRFVFDHKLRASNVDTILDFTHNADRIALDASVFKGIGSSLSRNEFRAGAGVVAARDRDDRIIYDTQTGELFYDRDGSKAGAAIHFATLAGAPRIDAGDFLIV